MTRAPEQDRAANKQAITEGSERNFQENCSAPPQTRIWIFISTNSPVSRRNDDSNLLVTYADQLICLHTFEGCVRKRVEINDCQSR